MFSSRHSPILTFFLPLLILGTLQVSSNRKIKVINSCGTTVWPAMFTAPDTGGPIPNQITGWKLDAGRYTEFDVEDDWTAGRVWARTGCTFQDGKFQCLTGACGLGEGGDLTCTKTGEPPATLAEFTLAKEGKDHYDVSLVDGFNVPLVIRTSDPTCVDPDCSVNLNPMCPPLLRTGIDQEAKNLGCLAACNVGFGQEQFGNRACCSGGYNDPELCAICGVDYYALFKDNCKYSYAYAYDEKTDTALHTCAASASQGKGSDYEIEFCPNRTDYVGAVTPDEKYLSATATCSNRLTSFTQTFPVGPSPTKTATKGTLQVVATVAPGVDGAAAIQMGGEDTNSAGSAPAVVVTTSSGIKASTTDYALHPSAAVPSGGAPSGSGQAGLVYGTYSTGMPGCKAQYTGVDGKITKVHTEVAGTTILEIYDAPTQSAEPGGRHGDGGGVGGQWLEAVPLAHQKKKKRGMKPHGGWF